MKHLTTIWCAVLVALSSIPLNSASTAGEPVHETDTVKQDEIEIKFTFLEDSEQETFEDFLPKKAKIKEQHEWHFDNPKKSFWEKGSRGFLDALTTLRVREVTSGEKVKAKKTRKVRIVDEHGKTLRREEEESTVSNAQDTCKELIADGYTDIIEIEKTRSAYTVEYEGHVLEIVRDVFSTPKKLGIFYEIELQHHGMKTETGLPIIYNFLKELGITQLRVYDRSYTHMIKNPSWTDHPEWKFFEDITL